jgi:hypothetical protein
MAKYIFLQYVDESKAPRPGSPEMQTVIDAFAKYLEEIMAAGILHDGDPCQPSSASTARTAPRRPPGQQRIRPRTQVPSRFTRSCRCSRGPAVASRATDRATRAQLVVRDHRGSWLRLTIVSTRSIFPSYLSRRGEITWQTRSSVSSTEDWLRR